MHLPLLLKHPEADVVAICDHEKSRSRLVAEKFGIKKVYTDLARMLKSEDLSAVIVCTSTDAHKENTLAALKAGKDVLVEKPIARNYAEAQEIAEAAKSTKRKLMVGMNHRFRPDAMISKSFIEGKELGKIYYSKMGWLRRQNTSSAWVTKKDKSGGGVFIDLGVVILDTAFRMMGFPHVRRVSATHFSNTTTQVEDTSPCLHYHEGWILSWYRSRLVNVPARRRLLLQHFWD